MVVGPAVGTTARSGMQRSIALDSTHSCVYRVLASCTSYQEVPAAIAFAVCTDQSDTGCPASAVEVEVHGWETLFRAIKRKPDMLL